MRQGLFVTFFVVKTDGATRRPLLTDLGLLLYEIRCRSKNVDINPPTKKIYVSLMEFL
jgi:hypothetical protein